VTIPDGYAQNVVIRWGEPILRGAPAFDPDKQTAPPRPAGSGTTTASSRCCRCPASGAQLLVANPTRAQGEVAWAAHKQSAAR
jgi:secreted PhoX family phosphatase